MKWIRILLLGIAIAGISLPAYAIPITYIANLDGASEFPPNTSPGTGFAQVEFDSAAHTLHVFAIFSDLQVVNGIGGTTAAHIHSATAVPGTGTAPVATSVPSFPGFPLGVTSGTYDQLFDLTLASSWNPSFITAHGGTEAGAEAFLGDSLAGGTAYFNIHTALYPGGEIRGFLAPAPDPVPEPSTFLLFGAGLAGVGFLRRRIKE